MSASGEQGNSRRGPLREFDLLKLVYASKGLLPPEVSVPPGDDMAALEVPAGPLLVAVDQVVEGIHFVKDEDPALVGRKVVARNVSDVAAMAGRPLATLVACALPATYDEARARTLYEALRQSAATFGCPLIGGDTTIHSDPLAPLVCSVTILGLPAWPGARVLTRRGGQVGDAVCVTGRLGGSLGPDGRGRHLTFEPRAAEGIELLRRLGPRLHAMIDISDGLGRDAGHLLEGDDAIAIELDARAIPTHDGISWQRAIGDGEDYELLFLASGDVPGEVHRTPVAVIGRVVRREPGRAAVTVRDGDLLIDATCLGWEHGQPRLAT